MILIWEWYLLEVCGAAPPNVLWSTVQEPIIASTRPQIRHAEAEVRATSADGPTSCLLESVCAHTHIDQLMDNMDAVDEARAAAAAREAEVRRQQREAAQARRRAEAEALRRQRESERLEAEQQRFEEREQRRTLRAAHDAMEAAIRQQQREQPRHGRRSTSRDDSPESAAPQRQSRANQRREPAPEPAPAPAAPMPQTTREMRDMIRAQQAEIDRMRSQLQTTIRVPAHALRVDEPQTQGVGLGQMANSFIRMFGGQGGDNGGGGGGAPPVRRHVAGQTMRESEVKGKLARFLAGMRAYERQRAAAGALVEDESRQQPLPPVLSEFISWAGDVLAGEEQQRGAGGGTQRYRSGAGGPSPEESARRYVSAGASRGDAAGRSTNEDEEETCCICLEVLFDPVNFDRLGEPLETACGHRFHAVCYANTMESTQQDPWCPICRSDTFGTSARFL